MNGISEIFWWRFGARLVGGFGGKVDGAFHMELVCAGGFPGRKNGALQNCQQDLVRVWRVFRTRRTSIWCLPNPKLLGSVDRLQNAFQRSLFSFSFDTDIPLQKESSVMIFGAIW